MIDFNDPSEFRMATTKTAQGGILEFGFSFEFQEFEISRTGVFILYTSCPIWYWSSERISLRTVNTVYYLLLLYSTKSMYEYAIIDNNVWPLAVAGGRCSYLRYEFEYISVTYRNMGKARDRLSCTVLVA
jgi:hypothetical protein